MNFQNNKISSRVLFISAFILTITFAGSTLQAQMEEVGDSDLSGVFAQAGITYNWGDSKINISYDSFAISDTDSDPKDWLEFNNITISGTDGYFTLDEAQGEMIPSFYYRFNTMDIATITTIDDQTKTVLSMVNSENTYPRMWNIGNVVFCSQDLGSIQFDMKTIDSTLMNLTAPLGGGSGIEFEYLAQWSLDNFTYNYNTNGGSLNLTGIHLSEFATGAPEDPTSWQHYGRFRIGDIVGGVIDTDNNPSNTAVPNPATFNVGTMDDGTTTTTCLHLNLPMKGSIRAEEVNFGGTNFGPVAIDGITAHYIAIRFNPGI